MVAAPAYGAFFRHGAGTTGLHELAWFLLATATLLLILIVADRSLSRLSTTADENHLGTTDDQNRPGIAAGTHVGEEDRPGSTADTSADEDRRRSTHPKGSPS
ncbi:hypothetical protein ACWT_6307 [Actinoplanes sp. SE50]|uniref:hypothetical protein n=1 Tax=unclassified Actinoplanes TaxID=2626549 RepID=UPI00023ED4DD|nr:MULTISPECIES: hypothetical protein [unclassified Actinoplanes]AEV87322.1 hypothetical protein ACPL_6440 [Actinoplanes sp. SE50/110]ATO85722.1 hypothetical protein ACWT_6307 [Actinoplanes sp. SE50]SLM03135.1 hypothetical protein ACSP50_6424 [Actinoplanes sp. SE50/110]